MNGMSAIIGFEYDFNLKNALILALNELSAKKLMRIILLQDLRRSCNMNFPLMEKY